MGKLLGVIIFFALSACNSSDNFQILTADQNTDLTVLDPQLRAQAQLQSSCSAAGADSECSVIGYTPKPCGQYSDYVVFSQSSDDKGIVTVDRPTDAFNILLARIVSYRDRVSQNQIDNGDVSTCDVTDAPLGKCVQDTTNSTVFKCQLIYPPAYSSSSSSSGG